MNLKKNKEEKKKQEEFFKQSRTKLFGLLNNHKCLIFFSALFASISGAVWPFIGVLLGKAINKLSAPLDVVFKDGRLISYYYLGVACIAATAILFQT